MMLSKFIFVWLLCLTAIFVQLPSASSVDLPKFNEKKKPIEQIVATIDSWFGCNKEKKQIDQLVVTIDALKQQIPAKNTLADMENALRREKAKNQELLNAISEHVTKEHEHEQQKKNLEERIVYLDNKVLKLLSNFTTELKNCTALKDSQSLMLEEEKGSSLRDKTALIANLELCEEKRKMFNNYVLDSFLRDSPYSGVENYTRYAVARLGMLPIKNAKPLIPEFGPVINDVLSFRYPINIPSCPAAEITNNTWSNPSVFIALISAPDHFKERNNIRETWLIHFKIALDKNLLGMGTRYGFFLGQTRNDSIQKRIEEENQKHGDIVQIEMDDSYRNLTLKGIAVLNWVRQHCASKVDLVFKVDDDVYVNVHNLVHFVRSNYQSNNSFFGYAIHQTHPDRGKDSKYYIPLEEYPWRHYPNYVQGPAYFIHASVVISLLAASQTIPFNPFEDVFLAGMCRERAGVKMQYSAGQPRFLFYIQYRPKKSERTPFSKAQFNVDSLFLTFKTSYYV
jgi:hypothetical protein